MKRLAAPALALLFLLLGLHPAQAITFSTASTPDATTLSIALAPDEHLDAEAITSPLPFTVAATNPLTLHFPSQLTTIPLSYQLCVGTLCYPPASTNISVAYALQSAIPTSATPITQSLPPSSPTSGEALLLGLVPPPDLLAFLDHNLAPTPAQGESPVPADEPGQALPGVPQPDSSSASPLPSPSPSPRSVWLALPGLLLAGVLLNLTPCTLPLIPVTLLILGIGRASAMTRRRRLLIGCTYSFGILLAYAALALISSATGNLLGAYAASPWFNLVAALLLILLALRPPDLARFRPRPKPQSPLNPSGKSPVPTGKPGQARPAVFQPQPSLLRPLLIAFLYGLLTAALASACTAPVLVSALTWSARLSAEGAPVAALLLPLTIGFGFALPWPFLALGISVLPRPGPWMTRLARLFTLLVLLLAAYYLFLAVRQFLPTPSSKEIVGSALPDNSPAFDLSSPADLGRLQSTLDARTGPVLLLFTASWCKNCHALQHTTLSDPAVQAYLADHDLTLLTLRADHPSAPPAAPFLRAHSIPAFPALLLLPPHTP